MATSTIKQDIFNLPNSLTMLRILLIPIVMWTIYLGDPFSSLIAALLFSAAAITDYLDGYIARKRNLVSLTGKFLDPLADKLIVMATLIMMVHIGDMPTWICVVVIGREISITSLRALASAEGIVMTAKPLKANLRSILYSGKYKTAFQLIGLIGMITHYEYTIDWIVFEMHVNFLEVGFWLFCISVVFSLASGYKYCYDFVQGIDQAKSADDNKNNGD